MSYSNFKVLRKEENYEENIRQTLKTHLLGMAWLIQLKFRIEGTPPAREFAQKKLVQEMLSYRCVKMVFSLLL